eukprot:Platyproteum_vivax@DN2161_c0_g1_i1.p1
MSSGDIACVIFEVLKGGSCSFISVVGPEGSGKSYLAAWAAASVLVQLGSASTITSALTQVHQLSLAPFLADPATVYGGAKPLSFLLTSFIQHTPSFLVLKHMDVDVSQNPLEVSARHLVLQCLHDCFNKISGVVVMFPVRQRCLDGSRAVEVGLAARFHDRMQLLTQALLQSRIQMSPDNIREMAEWTSGFLYGDILALCQAALTVAVGERSDVNMGHVRTAIKGLVPLPQRLASEFVQVIPYPSRPPLLLLTPQGDEALVGFDCVVGVEAVKQALTEQVVEPLKRGQAPCGIILEGGPGSGKSYIARSLGAECRSTVMVLQCADVMQSDLGATEKTLKKIFTNAAKMSPCVVIMEDVDSIAPNSHHEDDSRWTCNALVEIFDDLRWQLHKNKVNDVLVVGTTSSVDAIDENLVKGHRFSKIFSLPNVWTVTDQCALLIALLQGRCSLKDEDSFKIKTFLGNLETAYQKKLTPAVMSMIIRETAVDAIRKSIHKPTGKDTEAKNGGFELLSVDDVLNRLKLWLQKLINC